MAIRDKFRLAIGSRKSITSSTSTSSSTSQSHHAAETSTLASTESEPTTVNTTTTSGSEPSRKSKPRAFTWRSSKNSDEKKKKNKQKRTGSPDPREKPFTETNLRYQKMLGSYEMTFGTSRTEQLWDADGEISPGTSRQNSIEPRRC